MSAPLLFAKLASKFHHREQYNLDRHNFWADNRRVILVSLVLFVGVLLWRSWPNFTHPGLYAEDATHYFSYFYGNNKGFAGLFHNPNDYQVILNNFIATMVANIDVRWQPTFYLWIGATLSVLAVMALPSSGLLKNKYIIFISPFLLGFSGMNHLYYYVTLAYQIYSLVIILIGALFWHPAKGNTENVILFIVLSLLIWSGPYSVLVVPFSICFILFFKGKTKLLLALSVVTVLYALAVREHTIVLHMLWNPIIHQIWFDTFITKVVFMDLNGALRPEKILLTAVFFLTVFALLRRDVFYLKIACILLVLINSSLAALFLSKKFAIALKIRLCYLIVAQFLWLSFLLFTFDRILARSKRLYHGGIVVCALVVLFVCFDNLRNPSKMSLPVMTGLPKYLDAIYEVEQQNLRGQHQVKILEYGKVFYHPIVKVGKAVDPDAPVEKVHMED